MRARPWLALALFWLAAPAPAGLAVDGRGRALAGATRPNGAVNVLRCVETAVQ